MFIIYMLLVLMGLIIANFVFTYAINSATENNAHDRIHNLATKIGDIRSRLYDETETLRKRIDDLEARCKKFVGKGKKNRAPEVKSESKK